MKILASDYDNTLYVKNNEVFNKNIEAIKKFISRENIFCIITGRNYSNIKKDLKKLKIPYNYLICNDGAIIFNCEDKCLKKEYLPIDKINKIQEILEKYNYKYRFEDGYKETDILGDCVKITGIIDDREDANNVVEEIKEKVDVYVYLSTGHINIINSYVNKCTGLTTLSEIKNLDKNKIYVIGDEINDLEMLQKFKGVTMKEHSKELDNLNLKTYDTLYEYIEELSKN